jgi:hypothetical protein
MPRPYRNLTARDRSLDAEAMAERAKAIGPLILGDEECAHCGHPRNEHRTVAPHDCVLGHDCKCTAFEVA